MICPRCKVEETGTEQLTLCELCVCHVQAWAEEQGRKVRLLWETAERKRIADEEASWLAIGGRPKERSSRWDSR